MADNLELECPEMPNQCPACGQGLIATELDCPACRTAVKGRFALGRLAGLSKDLQQFLLVFIRNRGNIREVERELGLSYPTVRTKLDQLIAALGPVAGRDRAGEVTAPQRQEVLASLERGEITAGEAIQRLKDLKNQ